jgi:ubiquinol-cytochrome c reductase cytochrome b subunit
MFSALLILLIMPITDLSKFKGVQFRPFSKIIFFLFVGNFLILMQIGAKHIESPFFHLGQICTVFYFSYFLIIMPIISLIENSLTELAMKK